MKPSLQDPLRRALCTLPLLSPGWLGGTAQSAEPAHGDHMHHGAAPAAGARTPKASPQCGGPGLACATAATPAWAPDGTLWLAWAAGGAVSVARSTDLGQTFSAPVEIGRHGARLDTGSDARPQIAIDARGRIVVAYAFFKDERWNAQVLVSTSADGRQFSAPRPISGDPASQRFASIGFDATGDLFAVWIDKRLVADAARQGRRLQGASIAYAWSADAGQTFAVARIAHPASCECCRIGLAIPEPGRPVIVFRDVFEQRLRDHAMVAFDAPGSPGPLRRVAQDDWATDACPHHGPALAVSASGRHHVAWFTQGRARSGVFYANSADGGRSYSDPKPLAPAAERPARPALLAHRTGLWMAWKTFDGTTTSVRVAVSADDGTTWGAARTAAQCDGYSDHPLLLTDRESVRLSWLTQSHGYRLMTLQA